ncbi:MAG: UbiA-like polyprenyltransferase [Phycisphaerales bacterium]
MRDLAAVAGDIKLAHSIFALPFALLAAFLAAVPPPAPTAPAMTGGGARAAAVALDWPRFAAQLGLVVVAMVAARTCAMLANRLLDRDIDRENPRTLGRALPSGRLAVSRAVWFLVACAALFMAACAGFLAFGNAWPLLLGLPVLAWICAYGLLKRFTTLCHVYLGSSLAISPIAATIAIDPAQVGQRTVWLLAGMVLCWVAGFDVIYALQDVDADRGQGLHSLPSRWGVPAAMWASRALHVVAAACLWIAVLGDPRFGTAMRLAAALVTALLAVEHATVARWGTSRIALAFFTLNGVISCIVGGLGILDVMLGAA